MILFELTFPRINTWNNRWSGEGKRYLCIKCNNNVPKEVVGKSYYYDFGDGWAANIEVSKINCREADKLRKKSAGFYGYDWMIDSIIKNGKIMGKELDYD